MAKCEPPVDIFRPGKFWFEVIIALMIQRTTEGEPEALDSNPKPDDEKLLKMSRWYRELNIFRE